MVLLVHSNTFLIFKDNEKNDEKLERTEEPNSEFHTADHNNGKQSVKSEKDQKQAERQKKSQNGTKKKEDPEIEFGGEIKIQYGAGNEEQKIKNKRSDESRLEIGRNT